ncbi:MAG: tRNA lysidine(34) synthetase TilS [Acidobacteriota bacterium]
MAGKTKQSKQQSSHQRLSGFAQSLRREWRRLGLAQNGETVLVAVSGGADSVALLMALDELVKAGKLIISVVVAHLDHKLRGVASKADALWVAKFTERLRLEVYVRSVDARKRTAGKADNLEQAARRVRYRFLTETAKKCGAKLVVTGHTMDDQAETVLLNLLRGSGAGGLGGIEPVRPLLEGKDTILARPLVSWARRQDTENFCRMRTIEFRQDEMNLDERFARVRVRRQLLPLMEGFNPKVVEGLTRTAELLREDSLALDAGAARLLELASESSRTHRNGKRSPATLRMDLLLMANPALRRRALRQWLGRCRGDLRRLERVHILAVENLLLGEQGGRAIELPGGSMVFLNIGLIRYQA